MSASNSQCETCKNPLGSGKTVNAHGKSYHSACFSCHWCKSPLVIETYYTIDGKNVCQGCRNKERCTKCGFLITESKYVVVDGKTWHEDCFRCVKCLKVLIKFHFQGNDLYCSDCLAGVDNGDCAGCDLPLDNSVIKALGKRYHEDCFVCTKCFGPFEDDIFVNIGGNPYCDKCSQNPDSLTKGLASASIGSGAGAGAGAGAGGAGAGGAAGHGSSAGGAGGRGAAGAGAGGADGSRGIGGPGGAGGSGAGAGGAGGYGSSAGAGAGAGGAGGYGSSAGAGGAGAGAGGVISPRGAGAGAGAGGAGAYGSSSISPRGISGASGAISPRGAGAGAKGHGAALAQFANAADSGAGGSGAGGPGYNTRDIHSAPTPAPAPSYVSAPVFVPESVPAPVRVPEPTPLPSLKQAPKDDTYELVETEINPQYNLANLPPRGDSKFSLPKKRFTTNMDTGEKHKRDYKTKAAIGFDGQADHLKDLESLQYKTIRKKD